MISTCKLKRTLVARAATLTLLSAGVTALPVSFERTVTGTWMATLTCALADGGSGRGGDGSGGGHGGGGGDDRGDDSGGGHGGGGGDGSGGGHGGGGGDDSGGGHGGGGGDDSGGGHGGGGGDDSGGGHGGGGGDDSGGGHGGGGGDDSGGGHGGSGSGHSADDADSRSDRSESRATVNLSDDDLEQIMSGRRALVDDRGRVLELEIEIEHGKRTITVKPHGGDARRSPSPVENAKIVDVAGAPNGAVGGRALEVELEHGVSVSKPHGSSDQDFGRPVGRRSAGITVGQSSDDLSSSEEAALIRDGWR